MAREPVPREQPAELPPPPMRLAFAMRRLPETPPHRGRPTDLTNERANTILVALANGSYRGPSAQYAGVSEETLSRWMSRKGEPYETFQAWVREAEAYAEIRMVNAITSKATEKPEYAVAFLERKFPERWGRTVATSDQPGTVNLSITAVLQTIEQRATAARDPRPPRDGAPTVLDVLARRVTRDPIPMNGHNDNGEPDAEADADVSES